MNHMARSAVTPTLDGFYAQEIFWKLRFRCSMQLQCHEDRLANDNCMGFTFIKGGSWRLVPFLINIEINLH